jgi:hypothetical protein
MSHAAGPIKLDDARRTPAARAKSPPLAIEPAAARSSMCSAPPGGKVGARLSGTRRLD